MSDSTTMKERGKIGKIEFLQPIVGEAFVREALEDVADAIMVSSLGEVPSGFEIKKTDSLEKVARSLSEIPLHDPALEIKSLKNASPQAIFETGALTLARIEKAKEVSESSKLDEISGKVMEAVGKVLARTGGKKAMGVASGLALAATACNASTPTTEIPFDEPTPIVESTPFEATPEITPTSTPEMTVSPETEAFLASWAEKQEGYAGLSYEAAEEGGINVFLEKADGTKEAMFRVMGEKAYFDVLGSEEGAEVDLSLLGTKVTGGFEKLYFGTEAGEGHYMWRYPWGGWIENWNKTIEENGVGITVNEAELYGGLVTINPEQVEETWTSFVTGVYNVNKISKNTDILSKYPTAESFLRAARDGVVFESLRFLAPHPNNTDPRSDLAATWETLTNVDLTSVTLSFPELSHEITESFNPNTYSGITYFGSKGHFNFSPNTYSEDGKMNLRFSLSRYKMEDDILNLPGLNPENPPEKNLRVLTQLVRGFEEAVNLLGIGHLNSGYLLFVDNFDGGPLLFLTAVDNNIPDYGEALFLEYQDLTDSPLILLE